VLYSTEGIWAARNLQPVPEKAVKTANASALEGRTSNPAPAATRFTLSEMLGLATLVTVAAILRFHSIGARSFWIDEGTSVEIARLDWYNFARLLWKREANMSLYYLLLRVWLHAGSSEAFVRSFSTIFALAAILVIYLLGRRLFDSRTGYIAATLLALNAYDVRYSQEARSYTLMLLLCVLSMLYFAQTLAAPSRANCAAYVICSGLAVYAQFFSGLVILAQWLSLRLLERPRNWSDIRKSQLQITVAVLPIAVFVLTTGTGPLRWVQRPSAPDFWTFFVHLCGNAGPIFADAYILACIAALLLHLRPHRGLRFPQREWRYILLLFWLLFPPLLVLAVSWFRPLFVPRYFIGCLPALLLLAASGIANLRPRWLLPPALLLMLGLSLHGTISYYRYDFEMQRGDWRAASAYLLGNARSGDALLFPNASFRMNYEYYLSRARPPGAAPAVLYPSHDTGISYRDFVEKPDYSQIAETVSAHSRVWLVLSRQSPDAAADSFRTLLAQHFTGPDVKDFAGLQLMLYSQNRSEP